ncbi:hypothetical protein BGZ73_007806 [Actinomortierella ambigua]|nr:hypothetical protein BGZ73_007806 [Actinomortierella ambigua]
MTHQRLKSTPSTADATATVSARTSRTTSHHRQDSTGTWDHKTGLGYVHPRLMRNIRKKQKYVSSFSSFGDSEASSSATTEAAHKFEPRPTGRISEELEILCSALRKVGARQVFNGPNIHIVDTPKRCADALTLIQEYYKALRGKVGPVGLDSETTVYRTWDSSINNRTSILQIATEDVCLIVQLYYMTNQGKNLSRIPNNLREFLEDPKQLKVGVGIASDADDLQRSYGLKVSGVVDLAQLARKKGHTPESMSLEDLDYKFGAEDWAVVKTDDIYHWDFDQQMLHRDAIWYSGIDALSCRAIYDNLMQGRFRSTYVPWEKRFPMTPQQEYQDIIQFLHFKIRSNRVYPTESIKILLTKSYPRLKQIHAPVKLAELADIYISKLLKDGILVVDEKNATEDELKLTPDQISSATHPGLALKLVSMTQAQDNDQPPLTTSSSSSDQATDTESPQTVSRPPTIEPEQAGIFTLAEQGELNHDLPLEQSSHMSS